MEFSLVRQAFEEYRRGNYLAALSIYRQLGNQLGLETFAANIYLCEKQLRKKQDLGTVYAVDNSNVTLTCLFDERFPPSEALAVSRNQSVKSLLKLPNTSRFQLTVKYKNETRNRINGKVKSVLRIIFMDIDNNILNIKECEGLSWSTTLDTLYSYLDGDASLQQTKAIKIRRPSKAQYMRLEVQTWGNVNICHITNQVLIKPLPNWMVDGFFVPDAFPESELPKVACICDKFTFESLRYDLRMIPLSRGNWRSELLSDDVDALLVESAWHGNNGEWRYCISNPSSSGFDSLRDLVGVCKERGIKTIFYNKEDSPNYNVFIDAARLFDYIATSDVNCIEAYKKDCGHKNICVLPFYAQPRIHNPIGKTESPDLEVAFAGTWYANKHAERSQLLPIVLDPATDHRLVIFNRQSDWTKDNSYTFPDKYKPFLHDSVSYEEMLNIHKMFKVMLNVNSVTDSETMFSRRIFEILASSTPVISTESPGIKSLFKEIVPVVSSGEEAKFALDKLIADDDFRRKVGHRGYREVMLYHTARERLKRLFDAAGLVYPAKEIPKVTLAIATNRLGNLDYIKANLLRQTYSNLEAIVILNNNQFSLACVREFFEEIPWVKVIQLAESASLGYCLNASVEESTGSFWAKLDDDNVYLDCFVTDMMLPFLYTDASIVAKGTYFTYLERSRRLIKRFPGREHRWVDFASGSALIARKEVFRKVTFEDISVGEDTVWMKRCKELGLKMYSPDCYNYVVMRRSDVSSHTWQATDEQIAKGALLVSEGSLDTDLVKA